MPIQIHTPRPRWTVPLALLLLALGCDPDDDDDATGDDDASGDDDSAGDDDDATEWTDVLAEQDPEGDHGGSAVDIRTLQYAVDDTLALRLLGWDPFDDEEEGLWVGVTVGSEARAHRLTWSPADGDPLQLWTSADHWSSPLPLPGSMAMSPDAGNALVLAAALDELGFGAACALLGKVEVGCDGDGCADLAPDDGQPETFPLDRGLPAELWSPVVDVDDSGGGNGDGVIDAGEYLDLGPSLGNRGCDDSGGSLAATVSVHGSSTVQAALQDDTLSYGSGALAPGDEVAPGAPVTLAVGAGAEPGQRLVLQLDLTDGDGGTHTVITPALVIGKPRQEALAQLFDDGDDADVPFDVALAGYGVTGDELLVTLFSYGVHGGDEEVEIHLDLDRDGHADRILSTRDPDSGALSGGALRFDPWQGWVAAAPPTTLIFEPGTDLLMLGVPLAELGEPDFALLAEIRVLDGDGEPVDRVPDDPQPGDTGGMGVIALVEAPYLRYADLQLVEQAGNGDGALDAGEEWTVKVQLRNDGPGAGVDAAGTLAGDGALVDVADGELSFGPADGNGGTAWSLSEATLTLDPGAPPGADLGMTLAIAAAGYEFEVAIPLSVGGSAAK